MDAPELLTVKQVAELLAISQGSVYRLKDCGDIPHFAMGKGRGAIRFSKADVLAYLEKSRRQPSGQRPAPISRAPVPTMGFSRLAKYGYYWPGTEPSGAGQGG